MADDVVYTKDIVALGAIANKLPAYVDGDSEGAGEGVQATGMVTLSGVPEEGDTLILNGVELTFTATPTLPTDIDITSNDVSDILALLVAALGSIGGPLLGAAAYGSDEASILFITYNEPGVAGNSYTLAETGGQVLLSSEALEGGADVSTDPVEPLMPVSIRIAAEGGSVEGGTTAHPVAVRLVDAAGHVITFVDDGAGGWAIPVVVVTP